MDTPQNPVEGQKAKKKYHYVYKCSEPGCTKRPQGWTAKKRLEAHVHAYHPKPLPQEPDEDTSSEESEHEILTEDETPPEVETPLTQHDDDPLEDEQSAIPAELEEDGYVMGRTSADPPRASGVPQAVIEPHKSEHGHNEPQGSEDKLDEPQEAEGKCEITAYDGIWPTVGELKIYSDEKTCQFCGPRTPAFSKSTVLRAHVKTKHVATGQYPDLNVLAPEAKSFTRPSQTSGRKPKAEDLIRTAIFKKESTPVTNQNDSTFTGFQNLGLSNIKPAEIDIRATSSATYPTFIPRTAQPGTSLLAGSPARLISGTAGSPSTQEELQGIANQLNVLVESWLTVGNVMARTGELMRDFFHKHPHLRIDDSGLPDFKTLIEHGKPIGTFVRTLQGERPGEEEPEVKVGSPEFDLTGMDDAEPSVRVQPAQKAGENRSSAKKPSASAESGRDHQRVIRGTGEHNMNKRAPERKRRHDSMEVYEDPDTNSPNYRPNKRGRLMPPFSKDTDRPYDGYRYSSSNIDEKSSQALGSRIWQNSNQMNSEASGIPLNPGLDDGIYRTSLGQTYEVKNGQAQQVFWSKIG